MAVFGYACLVMINELQLNKKVEQEFELHMRTLFSTKSHLHQSLDCISKA